MTLEEIEAKIKELQAEKKRIKEKQKPKDIIKTEEYGWVKLLPFGLDDTLYGYAYKYTHECHKGKEFIHFSDYSAAIDIPGSEKYPLCESWTFIGDGVYIVKYHARRGHYTMLGKNVFLSIEDCVKFLKDNGYKGYINKENIKYKEDIKEEKQC